MDSAPHKSYGTSFGTKPSFPNLTLVPVIAWRYLSAQIMAGLDDEFQGESRLSDWAKVSLPRTYSSIEGVFL